MPATRAVLYDQRADQHTDLPGRHAPLEVLQCVLE
jgi:hypothetical protein